MNEPVNHPGEAAIRAALDAVHAVPAGPGRWIGVLSTGHRILIHAPHVAPEPGVADALTGRRGDRITPP